jgi:hypothetical protein
MSNASGIQYPVGFRFGVLFAINQITGRIVGNSVSVPYEGVDFAGKKAWALTIPPQRRIDHINADRVGASDFLPPVTGASGKINVSADNMPLDAIATQNKEVVVGESETIQMLSSNQGYENYVALFLYQQAEDYLTRLRTWRSFLIPRAKVIPLSGGFADREVDLVYDILITPASTNIFGVALTTGVDGAIDAQLERVMTQGRPAIAAWIGDGYTALFSFPADKSPARDTNSIAVYKNGVLVTTNLTKTVTGFTFTSTLPLNTDDIDAFWEY